MGNSDDDVAALQKRILALEFDVTRRDVIDRIRMVIQQLTEEDY
jgi:hypothetical protein